MVIRFKKQKQCLPQELEAGDCWIAVSLANSSGLILAARVGKHTDELIEQLVVSSEEKQPANDLTVTTGVVTSESYHRKWCITSARTRPNA